MELNIRQARERLGLSQRDVAGDLKVPVQTFSAWERGTRRMPIDQLIGITRRLDTSADFILGLISYELEEENRITRVTGRRLNSEGVIELARLRNLLLLTDIYTRKGDNV